MRNAAAFIGDLSLVDPWRQGRRASEKSFPHASNSTHPQRSASRSSCFIDSLRAASASISASFERAAPRITDYVGAPVCLAGAAIILHDARWTAAWPPYADGALRCSVAPSGMRELAEAFRQRLDNTLLRAPIAAVLIVVELTNDYGLIVPLMLAVVLSQLISHAIAPHTLEEDQLSREGVRHAPDLRDPLGRLVVRDVMTPAPLTFAPATRIVEAIERTRDLRHQVYPVVDEQGRPAGLLFGDEIARCVRQQRFDTTVEELRQPHLIAARDDEAVRDLLDRMAATAVDRCPVVDASGTVVGFVSPSDLMRARFREQSLIGEETLR